MFTFVIQRLLLEAVFDVIYFPVWWYSKGALRAAKWCFNLLKTGNERLAPGLWLQNIFVPMYGQWDWQGRIISFFMRFFQIIIRLAVLIVWLGVCLVLFILWLIFPVIVLYGLIPK